MPKRAAEDTIPDGLLEALEDALDEARAGRLRAVAIVADCEGDGIFNRFAWRQGWRAVAMVGVLHMLAHKVTAEEWRQIEDEANDDG